jgi:HSP20 family protein
MLYSSVAEPATTTTWRPSADVYRTKDGWLLKFELAGVLMDDVSVTARGSALTVTGVRRDQTKEEGCSQYSLEISYSRFERTIHLPCEIDAGALDIQYVNGILLVRVTV